MMRSSAPAFSAALTSRFSLRVIVLVGQDLRGGHEGAAAPALPYVPDQRRRHQGLAAAHVALYQPVHHAAAVQVGHRLLHCALLRPGGGEGERPPEFLQICLRDGNAALLDALAAHALRNVAGGNRLGEAFDDGRLSDARLAD